MKNVIDILEERGLLHSLTHANLRERVSKEKVRVYAGFDPTADSLHLGNYIPIITLAWFQRCGHTPVALVGGATGMIGDPGGRKSERKMLDEETLHKNVQAIQKDLEKILLRDPDLLRPIFLNNYEWFREFGLIQFFRDVGKHFRVGTMLSKESVKARMETEEGISFTEFSYQTLQGYDFYHLYKNYGVTVQIGGSDQWGNITAGTDFVHKVLHTEVYGLTIPLLTKSDGQKFGKSESGAIWLSKEKLSPFDFYQQLYRTSDVDVIRMLKALTFMEIADIQEIEIRMQKDDYEPNLAQRILAQEVTKIVHGLQELKTAEQITASLQPGKAIEYTEEIILSLAETLPKCCLNTSDIMQKRLIDILMHAKFVESKSEARRFIQNGGVWINNKKITDEQYIISSSDTIGKYLVVSLGKKNKYIIEAI